jgi:hypothetical protein
MKIRNNFSPPVAWHREEEQGFSLIYNHGLRYYVVKSER